jgi:nicotinamidase-related amidase
MDPMSTISTERRALVVCDLQLDLLRSLPQCGAPLLTALVPALEAARAAGWLIVFSGLRFQPGYVGVSTRHRLFGGLVKLNKKLGDGSVHWLMADHTGAEIAVPVLDGEVTVWRATHAATELAAALRAAGVGRAVVCGAKASGAVQMAVQALIDDAVAVAVVRECVADDVPDRLAAALDHLLPVYAAVTFLLTGT